MSMLPYEHAFRGVSYRLISLDDMRMPHAEQEAGLREQGAL